MRRYFSKNILPVKRIVQNLFQDSKSLIKPEHALTLWKKPSFHGCKIIPPLPPVFYAYKDGFIVSNVFKEHPNKILCLPPPKPDILTNVAGLWTPRPGFYIAEETPEIILKVMIKFILEVFGEEPIYTQEDLAMQIPKFFSNPRILNIKSNYYYPLAQHIMNSIFPFLNVPVSVAYKITGNLVSYSSFDKLTAQNIIEAFVFKAIMGPFVEKNKNVLTVTAQNHEDHLSEIHRNISYSQTGQPKADFRFEIAFRDKSNKIVKIFFGDAKLKTDPIQNVPLLKGSLCLTSTLDKKKYLDKLQTDLKFTIKNKENNNSLDDIEKGVLNEYLMEFRDIWNDKTIDIDVKYNQVEALIDDITLDVRVKSIVFSKVNVIPENPYFEQVFLDVLKQSDLKKIVDELEFRELLPVMFPFDGKTVHVLIWIKLIKMVSDKILLRKKTKELIEDNLDRPGLIEGCQ